MAAILLDEQPQDFSSNAHTPQVDTHGRFEACYEVPNKHPELSFEDGNLALLCGHRYFLVHRGVLVRHSSVLAAMAECPTKEDLSQSLEGRPILRLPHTPDEIYILLKYLYGLSEQSEASAFRELSVSLRLATTYNIPALRAKALRHLLLSWPILLTQWEIREKHATNADGVYVSRPGLPHPSVIIALAREVDAPELLPSAFYDLSRYLPSQLAADYTDLDTGRIYSLSNNDLFRVFRGKEQAARYFSTFIVKELEGRVPAEFCHNRNELQPSRKRRCQMAFEAVTYSLIRDVNGLVLNRNSDPLFAIHDSLLMQTREDVPGTENKAAIRACEACRMDFGAIVEAVREEFWHKLPEWFDLEVPNWV
ncbi:uncharacterized protein PHACADRAFT_146190 [Phanerochaete carnosa HHB-10118-sp]|uniref:BTB domain-containing protein n=1 Tax=Phanerochaete carnosa (strain HHB-10118-sp) TaxID=650164 RepID=K5W5F4_PHACS|nr:uncharacterized protein PHACADRAFT_146190 [Phanerochaete carnosa HHB-10118-sp]EKM54340.1 hypothetical protein PHACADRAFT_146190 [Phanerochaete carnosa HHB-10118-sp]